MATAVVAIVVVTVVLGVIVISLATAAVTMVVILKFNSRRADGSGVGRDPASGCPYVGTERKWLKVEDKTVRVLTFDLSSGLVPHHLQ